MKVYKPILLDLPKKIKTERLKMRVVRPGDGVIINAAVLESFEQFNKWLPWANVPPETADTEEVIRNFYAQFILRERATFVCLKNEELVGMCGIEKIDWDLQVGEIGYWCRTSMEGNGYISEAVKAITNYGFDNLKIKKMKIVCLEKNEKSHRVAERAGYGLETKAKGIMPDPHSTNLAEARVYAKFGPNN